MFRKLRLVTAGFGALAAVLTIGAGSAFADPGRGAIVFQQKDCVVLTVGTVCTDVHTVFNSTGTPSGNFISTVNTRADNSFTGAGFLEGCNNTNTVNAQQHQLDQDFETQEFHNHNKGQFSFECFGFALTCVFDVHVHFAEGQFQFQRSEFDCA